MTRRLRLSLTLGLAIFLLWSCLVCTGLHEGSMRANETETDNQPRSNPGDVNEHIDFWREFQSLLVAYKPTCSPPTQLKNADTPGFKTTNPDPRPDVLKMNMRDVWRMKRAHQHFVSAIKDDPPLLSYIPGTQGSVTTAGGIYLPVLVASLRMLRRTGSQLPMEVFLATGYEYEEYICDHVLPSLNAKCIIMSDILNAVAGADQIKKYQLKPFAMLFSSFEEILFLDADAFPISKPENLFEEEPFRSTNMITWPDFWASSASHYYYEIASQAVPPMEARQSTESGEVLISKKTHLRTLLLCTYYNFWGPTHYYRLFSQGAQGEGDKETFIAAAAALGEPFYQVSEPVCPMGHRSAYRNGFAGSAMLQSDPIEDYRLTQKGEWRINGLKAAAPRPFFIHANYPKFNPATIFEKGDVTPTFNDDGTLTRAWTLPEDKIEAFGSDVEKNFWEDIMWTACELEDKFRSWKDRTGICSKVQKYWEALFDPRTAKVA
ncbi:hypothetical protein N7470_000658 [Penicillium chermesinum]|nr:hypothetical protein N7470_000658 [Penicillium chermesinum]